MNGEKIHVIHIVLTANADEDTTLKGIKDHCSGKLLALYVYATEDGNFEVAFAIAAILMILTLLINLSATLIGKYFERKNKA